MFRPEGARYFPSMIEIFASIGLVSGGALVFFFFIEHFNLFEGKIYYSPKKSFNISLFTRSGFTGPVKIFDNISIFSMVFIISIAFGLALFSETAYAGNRYTPVPAKKALASIDGNILKMNSGNKKIYVNFSHRFHQDTLGKKESCRKCHHRNLTEEDITPCYICHWDMYQEVSVFKHKFHQKIYQDSGSCNVCHPQERTAKTFRPCKECHHAMYPEKLTNEPLNYSAPCYVDAMHKSCGDCHNKEWKKSEKSTPDYCNTCHKKMEGDIWKSKYAEVTIENQSKETCQKKQNWKDLKNEK
jgi:hypothetical protein